MLFLTKDNGYFPIPSSRIHVLPDGLKYLIQLMFDVRTEGKRNAATRVLIDGDFLGGVGIKVRNLLMGRVQSLVQHPR